jgi:diguanylate cyclase (GGDEF)-like protein
MVEDEPEGALRQDAFNAAPHVHRRWFFVAAAVFMVGLLGSFVGARAVATTDAEQRHAELIKTSDEIASTLQLELSRQADLVTSAQALLQLNPSLTNTQFAEWAQTAGSLKSHPGLEELGFEAVIPAAELPAFLSKISADPPIPIPAGTSLHVVPPGERPFYCLEMLLIAKVDAPIEPAGYDRCATFPSIAAAITYGEHTRYFIPYTVGGTKLLVTTQEVFMAGTSPTTIDEKVAACSGFVGVAIAPKVLLDSVLGGHPGTAATLIYRGGGGTSTFESGPTAKGASSVEARLQGGWSVRAYGPSSRATIVGDTHATLFLLAGGLMSLMLAVLIYVLGSQRWRAMQLVAEKTAEIKHQATHDALTGLPNRMLLMDRLDRIVARIEREGGSGAVLFLDLDGFKIVNDSFGHAVGDNVLEAVGARLNDRLRTVDTVSRIGGDEFIILIDGDVTDAGASATAERILELMRESFSIDGLEGPLNVTASIGIAMITRGGYRDLLRFADIALYEAKQSGRDRYAVYDAEMDATTQRAPRRPAAS